MPVSQTRIRVRYAETDQMGVVYYTNFFIWFEVENVELLRQLGFHYKQMEAEDDCHIPVVEANCRYKSPARYDDELLLETRVLAMRRSVIKFGYRLLRTAHRRQVTARRRGNDPRDRRPVDANRCRFLTSTSRCSNNSVPMRRVGHPSHYPCLIVLPFCLACREPSARPMPSGIAYWRSANAAPCHRLFPGVCLAR